MSPLTMKLMRKKTTHKVKPMNQIEKFWNFAKTSDNRYTLDLFGLVGGTKDGSDLWGSKGFNENEFLDEFRQIPQDAEINISINSAGGSVLTALSIYSILCEHKAPITIRVNGCACSAATIITSIPNAKVIVPLGSMMMIHRMATHAYGSASDLKKGADTLQKLEDNVIQIYANKTGKEEKEIRKAVEAESWYTAQEAVDFGLADEVDETITVTNSIEEGVIKVNGLAIPQAILAHAPARFFAAAQKVPAAETQKEGPKMDLEKLKAEHPELVNQIRQDAFAEGQKAERERIVAIENMSRGLPGLGNLIQTAKNDSTMTPEAFAVAALKAQQENRKKFANDAAEDAKAIPDELFRNEGNTAGVVDQASEEDDAQMKAVIEAGKKGFDKAHGKKI